MQIDRRESGTTRTSHGLNTLFFLLLALHLIISLLMFIDVSLSSSNKASASDGCEENQRTPYPIGNCSILTPMFLPPTIVNLHATKRVSSSDVYRDWLRSVVLDKAQSPLEDSIRMKQDGINSLKTIEQQLKDGTQSIDGLISQIHNQQQIEVITIARHFLADSRAPLAIHGNLIQSNVGQQRHERSIAH